jgi:hypothetical protein
MTAVQGSTRGPRVGGDGLAVANFYMFEMKDVFGEPPCNGREATARLSNTTRQRRVLPGRNSEILRLRSG